MATEFAPTASDQQRHTNIHDTHNQQHSNTYREQLSTLNEIYDWKCELDSFEHSASMSRVRNLQHLPLPAYGPKSTINSINEHLIGILDSVLAEQVCIDEAYCYMLLLLDLINVDLHQLPIMMPCYYVSFLSFTINFAVFSCMLPLIHDTDTDIDPIYCNAIDINVNYDGNNYALFQYLFDHFLPNLRALKHTRARFKFTTRIHSAIHSALQLLPYSIPTVICAEIASFSEPASAEFLDLVHFVNHRSNACSPQYLSTWNAYVQQHNTRKQTGTAFSSHSLYDKLMHRLLHKPNPRDAMRPYLALQPLLSKWEHQEAERQRLRLQFVESIAIKHADERANEQRVSAKRAKPPIATSSRRFVCDRKRRKLMVAKKRKKEEESSSMSSDHDCCFRGTMDEEDMALWRMQCVADSNTNSNRNRNRNENNTHGQVVKEEEEQDEDEDVDMEMDVDQRKRRQRLRRDRQRFKERFLSTDGNEKVSSSTEENDKHSNSDHDDDDDLQIYVI